MLMVKRISHAAAIVAAVLLFGGGASLLIGRLAADPPADRIVARDAPPAKTTEIQVQVRPTDDQKAIRDITVAEGNEHVTVNSATTLAKYLKRIRAADKAVPDAATVNFPEGLQSGHIDAVTNACRDAGFRRITLVQQPRSALANYRLELGLEHYQLRDAELLLPEHKQKLEELQKQRDDLQKKIDELKKQGTAQLEVELSLPVQERLQLTVPLEWNFTPATEVDLRQFKPFGKVELDAGVAELETGLAHDRPLLNGIWRATEIKGDGKLPKKLEWIIAAGRLLTFSDGTVHGGDIAQSHDLKNRLLCYSRDQPSKDDFRFTYQFVNDDTLRVTIVRGQKLDLTKYLVGDVEKKVEVVFQRVAATEQKK